MEIIELHSWLEDEWRANNDGEDLPMLDYARAVLAKWGTPAIEPVAHQDRLDRLIALDRDDPANTINQEGNGMTAIRDALIAIAAELEAR